jgi:hypothetical protein
VTRRRCTIALGLALTTVGWPAAPGAHRLDEYLQATRIGLTRDRVDLEVDLTPGAAIASAVVSSIDTDHDGQVANGERDAYAQEVVQRLRLVCDDRTASLTVTDSRIDPLPELLAGTGAVRIRATAALASASAGRHELSFSNAHRPETSVYLVNALRPDDPGITIRAQRRDPLQREISIEYDVAYGAWTRTLALIGGFVVVGAVALARRRRS